MVLRLILSIGMGGLIGWQREKEEKPAGLKTHILVCLGATIFMLISKMGFGDSTRMAAGVITGIGFLGAGTIIRARGAIYGLTTAASIWVIAGIGLAIGMGYYILAIISTLLIFGILQGMSKLETRIAPKHKERR